MTRPRAARPAVATAAEGGASKAPKTAPEDVGPGKTNGTGKRKGSPAKDPGKAKRSEASKKAKPGEQLSLV